MQIRLILFILLVFAGTIHAQQPSKVAGSSIIQLKEGATAESFIKEYQNHFRIVNAGQLVPISSVLPIYRFDDPSMEGQEAQLIMSLKQLKSVHFAQLNHVVSFRGNTPDDLRFGDQWYLKNTGQVNGNPGSDIGATLAWDITTGGITAAGDTIVVCVVDDGTMPAHSDLQSSLWVNKGEIPGNGIDDDNNGYIDDVNGWSLKKNSGDVSGGNHGVYVSGMIGASGNNANGIAGINWNVKIMNVVFRSTFESDVIQGYDYPLQQRLRYNATGGQEGAFVVVVNSSWGIDFGKPGDAPIWCNFYDVMGDAGILNVAATSNSRINVDADGDLPTACTSPFLISVGETNKLDQYSDCGYGVNSIDLGAPGYQVLTTRPNGGFGNGSGTSMASPLTAGIVALLYAYPCESLGALMHQDYPGFALMVKDALLSGVDQIPAFSDKVASGGRANAFNAMQNLGIFCLDCLGSEISGVALVESDIYNVSFNTSDTMTTWLRFRPVGSDIWSLLENVTSPVEIKLELACTPYELQLQNICASGDTSDWGPLMVFETSNCCTTVSNATLTSDVIGNVQVIFDDLGPEITYTVYYKLVGEDNFDSAFTPIPEVELFGLVPCEMYQWYVVTLCTDGSEIASDLSESFINCGPSDCDGNYCDPIATAEMLYIDVVSVNGDTAATGNQGVYIGYGDKFNFSVPTSGEFNFYVGLGSKLDTIPAGKVFVYIDMDQNGTFEPSEVLIDLDLTDNSFAEESINLANNLLPGKYRMRILSSLESIDDPCNAGQGAVEDHCLQVYQVVLNTCEQIDSITVSNVTFTTVDLSWEKPDEEAIAYAYRYRQLPDGEYTYLSDTAHLITVKSLTECEEYEFEVITVCTSDTSSFKRITFKTDCTIGVKKMNAQVQWKVYPNPFRDRLNVIITSTYAGNSLLRLTDLRGNIIEQRSLQMIPGDVYIDLEANNNLPSGVYFLTLTDRYGIRTAKLIKH